MTDPRISFVDSISSGSISEQSDRLTGTLIRIEVTDKALATFPGQVLVYQLATLAARLFDRVELVGGEYPVHRHFRLLSGAFLPALRTFLPTLRPVTPGRNNGRVVRVLVGAGAPLDPTADIFVGAVDWVALLSTTAPREVRDGSNPCGALAAAALAAGEVFKLVFDGRLTGDLKASDLRFSLLTYEPRIESLTEQPALPERIAVDAALVGCGSVGCAFLLGVLLTPALTGCLALVDNGLFDTSNPYKYSLLDWAAAKAESQKAIWAQAQIAAHAAGSIVAKAFTGTAYEYIASLPEDYRLELAASAVDTMEARLEVQDMLARRVVNAGISGTLVEVSSHDFGSGPCLGCLMMHQSMESWNAEPLALQTGLQPERVLELIKINGAITQEDVHQIISAGKIPMEQVLALTEHVGQPLSSFLNRLPYAETSVAAADGGTRVRVTTAFVSAFAGALLFVEFLKAATPELARYRVNNSYRQDLTGIPSDGLYRYERDPEGWCGCFSPFRLKVYREKYGEHFTPHWVDPAG